MVPLKITTDYSMLKSLITIPKLISYLKQNNISVCGICDTNLYGIMEFYDSCIENHIKPLIGLEIELNHIPFYLYAKDNIGYHDLLKLHTKKEKKELFVIDIETCSTHLNIILPFLYLAEYKNYHFPNFYIGYTTDYEKNNAYIITNNVVFCPDIKCFSKEDSNYLNMLSSIDKGESYAFLKKENYEKNAFETYLNYEIMEDKTEEFITNSNVTIEKNKRYIPIFIENSSSYLDALAKKGLQKRCANHIPEYYLKRLEYELSVIKEMGFSDYFLIVYDYVKYAKKNGILVGAGRGSAVGSLVSYSLGITDVDPLKYNLLFERFLNKDRITMPDIDIDFEEERREEVVSYVKEKYGKYNVSNIMTLGTLKSKLVLRSVAKSLEMNSNVLETFLNDIDAKKTLKENLENDKVKFYVKNNEEIKKLMQISLKLEGLKKHISTHAAGVVISSIPLDDVIPIHYNESELLTGVTMNYLEELGLLKMDFLSLRNLTIMSNILKLIKENENKSISLNQINLEDKNVLNMFSMGDTIGIFQFESEGMKQFLKKLKPDSFSSLIAALALYRPGPMQNIDHFIKRKNNQEKITYLHQDLEPILKETYGIIVYQEQVMQILVKIGGFTFSMADTIRRAISKKKLDVMEKGNITFMKGAMKKGYSKELAISIYDMILKFANYGFNKSHSVSYAMIGYQMAYLKYYYKIYFIANLLNMNTISIEKTKEYIAMAKRYHITILPTNINESLLTYKIEKNSLRLPLTIIKNVGMEASKEMINERQKGKFNDFFDFVSRTYGKSVNKKTIEALISSSSLDCFEYNHATLKYNLDAAINYATLVKDIDASFVPKPKMIEKEEQEDKRLEEQNAFGFYITNHPSSKYIDKSITKLNLVSECYGKVVKSVVFIEKIKEITTKKNEKMAFITASDEESSLTFVVFPNTMKYLENIKENDLVLVTGKVAKRFSDYQINVEKIEKIKEG